MYGCAFCADTEEFQKTGSGVTAFVNQKEIQHKVCHFVDCCVKSILSSQFAVNNNELWQSLFAYFIVM